MEASNQKNENLKIPYKFDSRYVFEDSITRIFRVLTECKTIEQLIINTKLPYIFSDNKEQINFEYILLEDSSVDTYKEIAWLLTCKQIQTPIKIFFNLTENTVDKTVLVVFEISIVKRELIPDIYKPKIIANFEDISVDVLNNLIIKLKNDNKDIYHYESKIFNYSREKIKDIIFNLNEIMLKRGYMKSIKREGKLNSEGELITVELGRVIRTIKLKIIKLKLKEKKVKWVISYMPLEVNFKDYQIDWNIIKIKPDITLLAIINKYSEQIDPNIMKDLTKRKKDIFQIIEEELKRQYP
jgi:hypothetical protein